MKQSEVIKALKGNIQDQIQRVEEFKSYNAVRLSTNPSPEAWNTLQCLEHLNRYAEFYVRSIGSQLARTKMKTHPSSSGSEFADLEFNAGYWGKKFIKSMMPDENGQIKKMKTFKSKNPSPQEAKPDSLERFLDFQEDWMRLLDQAEAFDLNRNHCSLTIPIIKMNLGATLQFVIAHQERHIVQAENTLKLVEV